MNNKQEKLIKVSVGTPEPHDEIYIVGDVDVALEMLKDEYGKAELRESIDVPDAMVKLLKLSEEAIIWCTNDWHAGPPSMQVG